MCACIVAGIALAATSITDNRILWIIAALDAQLRLTANMFDGMVALASGRVSKIGELYNEVPDRVSDAAVFIGAGFAWGGNIALGYIVTILAIFTAYVRAAGKIAGAPNEFCGPMAKQHRMLVLNALPMWRKNCGPHALADLRRKLQEEKATFIIFPEGGRSRDGSMKPFKHGLGMLVAETNVPVVPCGLVGAFEALPPDRKLPRPVAIKLVIGHP